jgi:hypothetical protein
VTDASTGEANFINPRRVRIVSGGLPATSSVTVDGDPLTNVQSAKWQIDANGVATATLTILGVELDVTVEACAHT